MAELDPATVTVTTRGSVSRGEMDFAREKVASAATHLRVPILYAEVELTQEPDPARERPAIAGATLDVNGSPVRARVAGREMRQALNLLEDRLVRRLERYEQQARRQGREQRRSGIPVDGEWRHGDLPTQRPEYFNRPHDERELVRTKTFALHPMTVDEAAFDLDMLGHDFYLFTELHSGADSVIYYGDGGAISLQQMETAARDGADVTEGCAVPVRAVPPAPTLSLEDAIERLATSGERFVFFADEGTGRGAVVYLRYDGHLGLINASA